MADRNADNADLVVDEMKRKARRRLVGAVVLALAAAIILPLLLEKEPRPLGDDVSVQIPPVDEGKFVNRLTGKTGDAKPLPKAESKTDPKPPPKPAPTAEPAGVVATPGPSAAPITTPAIGGSAQQAAAGTKPAPTESTPKSPAQPLVVAAAPAAAPTPAAALTPAPTKPEGFAVQLAAFADDKGANSLANKLKKVGYAAYVEPVETSRGTLWRVRVGGYEARTEAEAARVKLKSEGYSGIVAPVK